MTFFLVNTEDEPMIYFGGGGPDTVQWIVGADGVLHPSATFTRASTGTTELTQGVYSTAAVNEPRYQYQGGRRGLLIEPAATNLVFPSAVAQTMTVTVTAQAYTLSFFGTGSVTLSGAFTGVVTGTGTTLKESIFTPTAGALTLTIAAPVTQWQLEAGSKATSRIVTTSAAATRAPDVPTIATAAFGFNAAEGTFVCEFYTGHVGAGRIVSSGNLIAPSFIEVASGTAGSWDGSTGVYTSNSYLPGASSKAATTYSATSRSVVLNGGPAASGSGLSLGGVTLISIGSSFNGGQPFLNGVIFSLPYYPRKYSAAELQAAST